MAQATRCSRQMMAVLSNHGLVKLLVMHAISRLQVSWEELYGSLEEEVAAMVAAREEEPTSLAGQVEEEPSEEIN